MTTAALGATFARDNHLSAGLRAIYTRAALDAATGGGRQLPKTTAASLRLAADAEAGWARGPWRPFATFTVRHDSGDGDTGIAGDLGGGVEWHLSTATLRLEGAKYLTGSGAEEERLSLTAGKTAGRLNLGLTVTADNGVDTANLLTGELRF